MNSWTRSPEMVANTTTQACPLASRMQQLWVLGEWERNRLQEAARVCGHSRQSLLLVLSETAYAAGRVVNLTELGIPYVGSCTE